jgi:Cytochrome c554 and c-prime
MKGKTVVIVLLALFALSLAACAGAATASPTPSPTVPTELPPPPTPTPLPPTPVATANPHVAGADCAACHQEEHKRWATTLHAASPADVLLNTEHDTAELLIDECLNCHTPFQAGTLKVGDFVQPLDQKGPWKLVEANVNKWQAIKCEVCHDPTSTAPNKLAFFDPATHQYVPVKTTTELCEKCHQPGTDDSRDLKGSVHEGLQCATCHFVKGSEMSLDPHQACATCHPKVNPKHPDVTTLDTSDKSADSKNDIHFLTCATCHPKGTPTPAK